MVRPVYCRWRSGLGVSKLVAGAGHPPRELPEIVADLRAREGELVTRCGLERRPEHGPQIIEAAVRAGSSEPG